MLGVCRSTEVSVTHGSSVEMATAAVSAERTVTAASAESMARVFVRNACQTEIESPTVLDASVVWGVKERGVQERGESY
jgi:3-isopropylmalate dehydratase small subunit